MNKFGVKVRIKKQQLDAFIIRFQIINFISLMMEFCADKRVNVKSHTNDKVVGGTVWWFCKFKLKKPLKGMKNV